MICVVHTTYIHVICQKMKAKGLLAKDWLSLAIEGFISRGLEGICPLDVILPPYNFTPFGVQVNLQANKVVSLLYFIPKGPDTTYHQGIE